MLQPVELAATGWQEHRRGTHGGVRDIRPSLWISEIVVLLEDIIRIGPTDRHDVARDASRQRRRQRWDTAGHQPGDQCAVEDVDVVHVAGARRGRLRIRNLFSVDLLS